MRPLGRYLVGTITLLIGVMIVLVHGDPADPTPATAYVFGAYLLFCSVCCFVPALIACGGGRIVAAGASILSLALTGFVFAKFRVDRDWTDLHVVYYTLPIGIAMGIYVFTQRFPGWLAGVLHLKANDSAQLPPNANEVDR